MSLPANPFLLPDRIVDSDHPDIAAQARALASDAGTEAAFVERCFAFVRDDVRHSVDAGDVVVTCRASDVLRHRTGYCYAKSHLLAALLRAGGVPAGLCYQRLATGDPARPFCLHGLNAVLLRDRGWFRIDPRGNKPGIDARFEPPVERLAFAADAAGECTFPQILAAPLALVVATLERHATCAAVLADLPDAVQIGTSGQAALLTPP